MKDNKEIMNVFVLAYKLLAEASKLKPSLEGFQQVLEMLGEDGIQQCAEVIDEGPEAVAKIMIDILQEKLTLKAANGAKLRYIKQLQGKCQPGYFKKGGRCKPCEMEKGVFNNRADLFNKGGDLKDKVKKDFDKNNPFNKQPQDTTRNDKPAPKFLTPDKYKKQKTKTQPNLVMKQKDGGIQFKGDKEYLRRSIKELSTPLAFGRTGYMAPINNRVSDSVLTNKTNPNLDNYLRDLELRKNIPGTGYLVPSSKNENDTIKSEPIITRDEFEPSLNNTQGQSPQNPILLPSMLYVPNDRHQMRSLYLDEYLKEAKPKRLQVKKWQDGSIALYREQYRRLKDGTRYNGWVDSRKYPNGPIVTTYGVYDTVDGLTKNLKTVWDWQGQRPQVASDTIYNELSGDVYKNKIPVLTYGKSRLPIASGVRYQGDAKNFNARWRQVKKENIKYKKNK